ncbi:hypothetical protein AB6A40_000337 [Gnathostoma spinigerum]|uniref:Polo kinase n=1 Tax=Gnathostoma spinigerum TaxID=75299 RepID=A0ABD6E1Z3_9BILA
MALNIDHESPCTSSCTSEGCDPPPPLLFDPTSGCRYSIVEYLEKGGFAKCYSATAVDSSNATSLVALKVISKSRLKKHSNWIKMHREIDIHRQLEHPNIVKLITYFEDVTNFYMVLELCGNNTLLHQIHLSEGGRLCEETTRHYLSQIVDGILYLHEVVRILHRDLKPGNMLVNSEYQIKLADFGFAVPIDELPSVSLSVCGTPNYISPQVISCKGYSKEAEAWSVGCTLYCMLIGKPPFECETLEKTYAKILKCDYIFPSDVHISNEAKDLVSRLIELDPLSRLRIISMKEHEFFWPDRSNRFFLKSSWKCAGDGCADHLSGKLSKVLPPIISPVMQQYPYGGYSGDSGIGSDGYLGPRITTLPKERPETLFEQVMAGHYAVTDEPPLLLDMKLEKDGCEVPMVIVSKWVDYSNKHGFGCVLSDGTYCMLFNDGSSLSKRRSANGAYYFHSYLSDVMNENAVPFEWTDDKAQITSDITHKIRSSDMFRDYMNSHLETTASTTLRRFPLELLVRYRRVNDALLMILSGGTAQINLISSHYKLVLDRDATNQVILTVFHPQRNVRCYRLANDAPAPLCAESNQIQDLLNNAKWCFRYHTLRSHYATEC